MKGKSNAILKGEQVEIKQGKGYVSKMNHDGGSFLKLWWKKVV